MLHRFLRVLHLFLRLKLRLKHSHLVQIVQFLNIFLNFEIDKIQSFIELNEVQLFKVKCLDISLKFEIDKVQPLLEIDEVQLSNIL